jgi:streptogramin lyase
VNDSGSDEHLIGGPGNIAFDSNGYAWITNNTVQGTPHSSQFNVVLKPNGQPADGKHGAPRSPLLGGGILGAGYGVAVAPNGKVWFGNFGWGGPAYNPSPTGNGSVSEFSKTGHAVSGKNGYQGGTDRVQGIAVDAQGNIWLCSFGNERIVVFLNGNPNRAIYFQQPDGSAPFDIRLASDGTAWVTNSSGLGPDSTSNVSRYRLVDERLELIFSKNFGHAFKGIALDSRDHAWVASGGDGVVYYLNPQGNVINHFAGGGMNAPWGVTVDGDDNVWVVNFGPQKRGSDFTTSCVTKLAGSNPATRPPGLQTGDPISPASGYTLPSAGAQVRLHNGEPLYGAEAPPSFTPLMRLTAGVIDRAGNLWVANNWKPDLDIDVTVNPGGDGICIFVGLAKPQIT